MSAVEILVANVLDIQTDVLVISANPSLLGGSGVSGVIHISAGPELEEWAKPLGPLKPGEALITPGFKLRAQYVVHSVCPRYLDGIRGEYEQLASAYARALGFYDQLRNPHSVAFISMGTEFYKWPLGLAAKIAVKEFF